MQMIDSMLGKARFEPMTPTVWIRRISATDLYLRSV